MCLHAAPAYTSRSWQLMQWDGATYRSIRDQDLLLLLVLVASSSALISPSPPVESRQCNIDTTVTQEPTFTPIRTRSTLINRCPTAGGWDSC